MDPADGSGNHPWTVNIDGEELAHLGSRYSSDVSDEDWDSVVRTAADILGRCPRPEAANGTSTELAIGKVQSGKTLSYSTLAALAYDNGYSVVIVLAGTKNLLLDQTFVRLSSDLVGNRPSITQFKNPTKADSEVIESVLHTKRHALVVVLKRQNRILEVKDIFAQPSLNIRPVLIIDDEGDESSLNTQFKKGKQSAVYRSILSLRNTFKSHSYVAYTATPQGLLLIDGIDALSPDFGTLIYPGSGYCGGSVFFGERIEEFVRQVPVDDANKGSETITASLSNSIAVFIVGATIRHMRGDRDWHSMLIHNSSLRVEHSRAFESVKQLILSWKTKLGYQETDPERQALLRIFESAYDDLVRSVQDIPSWESLKNNLSDEIWQVEVWMVNSLQTGRDPMSTPIRLLNNIFVGGNMLGRGLTIKGLAVTYITRRAMKETNADTLEQRARWFGYKMRYLDTCRIFLTEELKSNYRELLRHEDDFWEALSRNMSQGIPVREWPRMFRLDPGMYINPTRQNIANYKRFRGSGWEAQRKLVEDPAIAEKNVKYVKDFFSRYQGVPKLFETINHTTIENCSTEVIISELLENVNTENSDWDNSYYKEYLTRLLLNGVLNSMEVLLMRNGEIEDRTKRDGRVNPFAGRSNNYYGDQYIHGDKVQFQVHIIAPREQESDPRSVVTTSFGLYVPPDDPRFNLDFVVRGKTSDNN